MISISTKAASSTASGYSPNYGLIGAHSSRGWRPSTFAGTQYLEFRFSSAAYVTSMEIKGAGSGYYVRTFTVRYYNSTAGAWVCRLNRKYKSLVVRKPVFGVSNQVRHKPGCTATEAGWRLETSDLGSRWAVLSISKRKQTRMITCEILIWSMDLVTGCHEFGSGF